MNIKELEKEFIGTGSVKGFKYILFESSEYGFLYEVYVEGVLSHYEVFEKKLTPVCLNFEEKIFSKTDFKVRFPRDNDFGDWAWCFTTLDKAFDKFNEIIEDGERRDRGGE
jgi:hypothetical protein